MQQVNLGIIGGGTVGGGVFQAIQRNGALISSRLGARLRVACIGAVCTDPGHRGQGFASALMADARRQACASGASLMLISGGRGLYHRLGYVNVGCFERYQLGAGELHGLGNPGITLTGYREEDLPGLATLHQTEPVRFLRSAADWQQLMGAGHLMCAPTDLLGIRQDGGLVASAVRSISVSAASSVRISWLKAGCALPFSWEAACRRCSSATWLRW